MDFVRWGIAELMNELLESTQNVVVVINFISVSDNEVIATNNTFGFLCIYMLFKVGNKFHFWLV
jgi:serine protease inhibitor